MDPLIQTDIEISDATETFPDLLLLITRPLMPKQTHCCTKLYDLSESGDEEVYMEHVPLHDMRWGTQIRGDKTRPVERRPAAAASCWGCLWCAGGSAEG